MPPNIGPPVPVSPLIRGARFALLFAGIVYARLKQSYYTSVEEVWKEEEAAKKVIRDAHIAAMKRKIAAEERATLKLLESGALFQEDLPEIPEPKTPSVGQYDNVCKVPEPEPKPKETKCK